MGIQRKPPEKPLGFFGRLRQRIGLAMLAGFSYLTPQSQRAAVLREALTGTLIGDPFSADPDMVGYRRITDPDGRMRRDLTPLSHDRMVQICVWLFSTDPLARFLIRSRVALAVGKEIGFTVEINAEQADMDPQRAMDTVARIREDLGRFWDHPAHDIRHRPDKYAKTYLVTGHLVLPITVANEADGLPQLDVIDAQQIAEVYGLNGSAMVPDRVSIKSAAGGPQKLLSCVRPSAEGLYSTEGLEFEPVLYFRHSELLNSLRGQSDLMDVADWVDGHNQFLFSSLDRAILRNAMVWWLKVNGASAGPQLDDQIANLMAAIKQSGGVYATNEQVEPKPLSAQIEAGDMGEVARLFRTYILGAKGIPESWYSEGGNANRATASDQTDVAYKQLLELQEELKGVFRTILHFGYDSMQAKQPGVLPSRSNSWLSIEPDMPIIAERDTARLGTAFGSIEAGVEGAIEAELMSRQTGRKLVLGIAAKLGDQVDADVDAAQIDSEREEKDLRDAKKQADAAAAILQRGLDRGSGGDDGGAALPAPGSRPGPAGPIQQA